MKKVKRSTFKVLFCLKKNAPKKNGKVAIMGRITIDNQVAQFSTKLEILPQKWDLKYGRVTGKTEEATQLNRKLEEIRSRIITHYKELMKYEGVVTAQKLKATFLGIGVMEDSLLKVYENFKEGFALMVEKGVRSYSTLNKYENVYTHLSEFIQYKYRRSDISFKELTEDFINDFDFYLRVNKSLTHNTIWVYMMPLCKMVEIAIDKGIIYRNPFKNYISSMEEKDRGYLLREEVETLLQYHPKSASAELVRDLFVFSCFTGFSYIDIKQLKKSHLQSFFDGNKWLIKRRQKSDVPCNVRLLDIAEKIIEKYEGTTRTEALFPTPSNTNCNLLIRKMMKDCNIIREKPISFHWARHTFGTLFLTEGVPLESVSKMMGHKNIKTTQIYAKITNEKISKDMEIAAERLKNLKIG